MEGTGYGTDSPRQRFSAFSRKKWISNEKEAERNLPSDRNRCVTVSKMQGLPFAFDSPCKDESNQSDPTVAREQSEPEQKSSQKKRSDEKLGWIYDREFRYCH